MRLREIRCSDRKSGTACQITFLFGRKAARRHLTMDGRSEWKLEVRVEVQKHVMQQRWLQACQSKLRRTIRVCWFACVIATQEALLQV